MNPEPKKRKRFNYKLAIILLIGSVGLILLIFPMFMPPTGGRGHNLKESISNQKQLSLALLEFESDFGAFPNRETAKDVTEAFPDHGYDLTGNFSNALFRQLLAAGIVQSEEIFHVDIKNFNKPNGNIAPGEALRKGEVGFAYISNQASAGNPFRPLLLCPLIPGTTKFDPKPFNGHAVILKIDQSVKAYKIREDGTIHDKDGDILSPNHPMWNGKAPTIHYPE